MHNTQENIEMANNSNHFSPLAINELENLLNDSSKESCIKQLQQMYQAFIDYTFVCGDKPSHLYVSNMTFFYNRLLNVLIQA